MRNGIMTRTLLGMVLLLVSAVSHAERIKDLATIEGVRENQLIGYGLVVGLDGTGDQTSQTPFTVQSLKSMLKQLGVTLPANVNPQLKNVAAVMVHANLPPFYKPGQTFDVTVASLGNAKSLRGGSLIMTPLKGADGNVYAIAQGNVVVGGLGVTTQDGSSISINIPSAGRIANGATVERAVPTPFDNGPKLTLVLNTPDFTTATRMVQAIDDALGNNAAQAVDGGTVAVVAPTDPSQRVTFMSMLENLTLNPGEEAAKVVVNSRTGTVVIGRNVRVNAAAVTHGNLTVTISSNPIVSQPGPLSGGTTAVVPNSSIDVKQEKSHMFLFNPGASLDDIVRAVNGVGAAPGDLVAILEALKEAGALRADLVII